MGRKSTKNNGKSKCFYDTYAIYYNKEDKCWVAHSCRTDQFGTGDCVLQALIDGMNAVDQVIELAKERSDIQVFCDAPQEILDIAQNAQRLPDEIYEIAHKTRYGEWPPYKATFDIPTDQTLTRRVKEAIPA